MVLVSWSRELGMQRMHSRSSRKTTRLLLGLWYVSCHFALVFVLLGIGLANMFVVRLLTGSMAVLSLVMASLRFCAWCASFLQTRGMVANALERSTSYTLRNTLYSIRYAQYITANQCNFISIQSSNNRQTETAGLSMYHTRIELEPPTWTIKL
jgi:hypothetical protein